MMPERRTSTKSDSLLRRTLPPVVANITSRLAQEDSSSGSGMMVVMRSPCSSGRMLISALPRRVRRRHRQPPDLFLVDLAARREEQHRRMGRGHEQPADKILVAGLHAGTALAAAALRAIGRQRHALDVAGMRDRHHHVLALDQVLVLDLVLMLDDFGLARRGEFRLHRGEFVLDDGLDAGARAQDLEVIGDFHRELVEFLADFLAAERGQARQAQIENGLAPARTTAARCRLRRAGGADRRSA